MASGLILDWDTRDWRPALVPQYPTQDHPPPGLDPGIARAIEEMYARE